MMRSILLLLLTMATVASGASGPLDTLRFSHKTHLGDIGAQCSDCHQSVVRSEGPTVGAVVPEAVCKKCHDNSTASFECTECHTNSANVAIRGAIHLKTRFSHKRHLSSPDQTCLPCHQGIESVDKSTRKNLPVMETCRTCHNNRKASASCSVCHVNLGDIKPATHDALWIGRGGHGFQARFSSATCTECHTESSCTQCHQGNTPVVIHSPGYEFEHGMDVKRKDLNCGVCHQASRFCERCHEGTR